MADQEFKPLTGRPDFLRQKAAHYEQVARDIAKAVQTLRSIRDESMRSEAIDALKDKSGEVADDITKAYDRYNRTAGALTVYANALDQAQQDARAAILEIAQKQDDADAAARTASTAQQTADSAADDDKSDAQHDAKKAQDQADDAQRALDGAKAKWHAALDDKNNAAHIAASAIDDVVNGPANHGLKDSWWDNWGADLYKAFKAVCKWAAILSIFLGWVPILGQVLLILAAIGAVLDLVDAIVAKVTGNGSWGDILLAAGGVALTFVGGAAFARIAKGLKSVAVVKNVSRIGKLEASAAKVSEMRKMKSILNIREGETIVGKLRPSSTSRVKMFSKSWTRSMFKDSLAKFHPKLGMSDIQKLRPRSVGDAFKQAWIKGVIPNPKTMLGVSDDYVQIARLVAKNPELLRSPEFVKPAVALTLYQADQTFGFDLSGKPGAVASLVSDPLGKVTGSTFGPTRDLVQSIPKLVHDDWKWSG
ncbi:putative T7SS-secreted protein [Gryllotalpicola koreensis]|uniref:Putative T7SS secretion signal domain-containing protein n=1 Tax=Gryllotalpicola koreensis TaxID=993086 RepID=A0ABP8A5F2_9MICO